MFKILKNKSMMMFITVTVIGGISITSLSMFHNGYTEIKKSQDSNVKENYINDVAVDSQNTHKSDSDKDLNSLSDTQNLSDNSQNNDNKKNKQKTTSSNLEKSSNNSTTKKTTISSQLKEVNSNENTKNQVSISEQKTPSSQLKEANSNVNTEKQASTNAALEVKVPTIYYDRTTSIYTDDMITLLRVEYYLNNKLIYYSVIENFDATTKSYIEKIYQCNRETNIDPLIRTDVYVNGNLTKSY